MKDMLGTEVVVGDTVVFTDPDNEEYCKLTIGMVDQICEEYGTIVVTGADGNAYILEAGEFAYYTTIKDLT
jgi:hypothetical protein